MYEYDGAQYIHWAAVAAVIVVLVYYVKQFYCPPEGYKGNPFLGAFDQVSAGVRHIEQEGPLSLSASGRTSVYGVKAIDANAPFSEGFLGGQEAPYIGPPAGVSGHTYQKAVYDVKQAAAEGFDDFSSAKPGLTEDDAQFLLNQ